MSKEKKELSPLETLNADIMAVISSFLDKTNEPQKIKSIRQKEFPFFRSKLMQKNRILARLAQYAAEGNIKRVADLLAICPDLRKEILFTLAGLAAQNEMEAILKKHPEDLLVKAPLHDISGRTFESISVFQHAIWTKDVRYMANMMLDCLPKNLQGEQIRAKLLEQYKELMAKGVAYQLNGVRYENERHFNIVPLTTALSNYTQQFNTLDYLQRKNYWCKEVGGAIALTPAHIRHHYCDSKHLFLNNNIKAPQLERSLEIYNFDLNKRQLWTESLMGLGNTLGICSRSVYGPNAAPVYALSEYGVTEAPNFPEIVLLHDLDEHRTKEDFPALMERLQTPTQYWEEHKGSVILSVN